MGLLTAIAGAAMALYGGDIATRAHNVSNFEGGRAMGLVFVIMPAGFIVGLIVGMVVSWKMARSGYVKAQAAAIGIAALIASVVFGVSAMRAPRVPLIDGNRLVLELEVRLPEGRTAMPDIADEGFSVLFTSRGQGDDRRLADLDVDRVYLSDGRLVIPGVAPMFTTTRQRSFVVNDVGDDYFWFDLPLRAAPTAEDEAWTDWWPAPGQSATADIRGNGGFQIRYRVQQVPPAP